MQFCFVLKWPSTLIVHIFPTLKDTALFWTVNSIKIQVENMIKLLCLLGCFNTYQTYFSPLLLLIINSSPVNIVFTSHILCILGPCL